MALAVVGVVCLVYLGVARLSEGDPEIGQGESQALIEAAITRSFTESDPAHCEELYTQALMDQTNFGTGPIAVRNCIEQEEQEGGEADAVRVLKISVAGEQASTTVAIDGGILDRATLRVELEKDEAAWKLDRLASIDLDRGAYEGALATRYVEEGLTRAEADCVAERFGGRYTIRELERSVIDEEERAADPEMPVGCLTTATLRQKLVEVVRKGWAERGLPADLRGCMLVSLRGLPAETLRRFFDDSQAEASRSVTENLMRACVSAAESRSAL